MTPDELVLAAEIVMKLQAELSQLRAENKQLREWNKGFADEIRRLRADKEILAKGSFV